MENYVFDGLSCCCVLAYCKLLPLGPGCWLWSVWHQYTNTVCSFNCRRAPGSSLLQKQEEACSRACVPLFFLNILAFPCRMSPEILGQHYTFCVYSYVFKRDFEQQSFNSIFSGHFCDMRLAPTLCCVSSFPCNSNETPWCRNSAWRSPGDSVWLTGKVCAFKLILLLLNVFSW